MVVKINKKPIKVRDEEDKDGTDWVNIVLGIAFGFVSLGIINDMAYRFMYIRPYPFLNWIGDLLRWLF